MIASKNWKEQDGAFKVVEDPIIVTKKERHDRESNPGHLRDRQVYSPLYYRDSMFLTQIV